MIEHYSDYGLFLDNCQAFAVRRLGAAALCPSCVQETGSEPSWGPTNAFYSIYTILYLRFNLYMSLIIAAMLHVVLKSFGREHILDILYLCIIAAPPIILTTVVLLTPQGTDTAIEGDDLRNVTLDSWELSNVVGSSEWNMQAMSKEADCDECASIAAKRTLLTRKCFCTHSKSLPRRPKRRWRLCKGLITFTIWSGTVLPAFVIHPIFCLPGPYLISVEILSQMISVVMAINLESDLCRTAHGVRLIYRKTLWIQIYSWSLLVWIIWDLLHAGAAPDLQVLGIWRYPIYLCSIEFISILWFYYQLTPGRIAHWLALLENQNLYATAQSWIKNETIIKSMEPWITRLQHQLDNRILSVALNPVLEWYQRLLDWVKYWEKGWFWAGVGMFFGLALVVSARYSIRERRKAVLF